jgi:hypothetical protein
LTPAASITFIKSFPLSSTSPFYEPSVLGGFRDDYEFALIPNWDGRGAVAVSGEVRQLAVQLIQQYGGLAHLVEVAPGRDGSLSFTWDDSRGNYVYLDVGPRNTVHLFYEGIGSPKWEGVSISSDTRIFNHLVRAFGFLHQAPTPTQVINFPPSGANTYAHAA